MSSTSSINTVSSAGNKNYVSGLASGMDTESMVQSLLSGTQSKIDKQTGLKQQLEWKQDIYRDLIMKINSFGDKYFSYYGSGDTNFLSPSLFKTMTGISSSSAVKVAAVGNNAVSGMNITSIKQLAAACKVMSASPVTKNASGKASDLGGFTEGEEYSFSVTLDGVTKTINFTGGTGTTDQERQEATLADINKALYRNFGTAVGMEMDSSSRTMALVKLDGSGKPAKDDSTGASVPIESSRRVIIESAGSDKSTVEKLGFAGGFSNKLDYATALKNMNFATGVQGDSFEFEINGVAIKGLTSNSTLSEVLSAVNGSDAGVKVSYSSTSDGFIMESTSTGDISNITMSQSSGNLLSVMFGIGSSKADSRQLNMNARGADGVDISSAITELNAGNAQSFVLQVDGRDVTVKIEGKKDTDAEKTQDSIIEEINSQLDARFGAGQVKLSIDDSNHAVLKSAEHEAGFSADNLDSGIAGQFGFKDTARTGIADGSTKLSELGLSGSVVLTVNGSTDITLNDTESIDDLVAKLGAAGAGASFENGRLGITGAGNVTIAAKEYADGTKDTGGTALMDQLFGQDAVEFAFSGSGLAAGQITAGQNAVLTVNGSTIERNTNAFELDGITIELTSTFNETGASGPSISLTTSRDTDKIVDSLKSFVDDYNSLIEELNKNISEEASYKKYTPLTDEQKKEMSDREVELWEEKSKQGLLRNDSNVSSFLSGMRMALYSSVEGAGLSLFDIGIETSDKWQDKGRLVLDETALRTAISTNAEGISKLFTDRDSGLGIQMQNVIKAAANVNSGSPGSMVRYAGTTDVLATSNTLYKEMKSITETLSNLNVKYEQEKTRYWRQFNAMEQAISNMNSQSSWLAQQFSS